MTASVISMCECNPSGPVFDSQLFPKNVSCNIGSILGSTSHVSRIVFYLLSYTSYGLAKHRSSLSAGARLT